MPASLDGPIRGADVHATMLLLFLLLLLQQQASVGSGRNTPTIGEDGAYSVRPGSASSAGYEPATAEHDEVLVEQASVACSLAAL